MADFNPENPRHLWQLRFEGEWPTAVALLGSGQRLAAANRAGLLCIWDLPDSREAAPAGKEFEPKNSTLLAPIRRLEGHTNGITRLIATADGRQLISASLDNSVRVWDLDGPTSGTTEVILDSDSRRSEFKKTKQEQVLKQPGFPVETQTACQILAGHRDWVMSLGISGDGRRLISGDGAAQVIVWDLAARKQTARWSGHPWNWIVAAALSPDGNTALVSEYRYKRDDFDIPAAALKLWNVADASERRDLLKVQFPKMKSDDYSYGSAQVWRKFVADGLIAADFSPDGKLIAVGQGGETDTGKVHLLETETGKLLRTISGHQYGVTDVKFSNDGRYVLSTGRDTTLRICQTDDGKEVAALGKPRGGQFKDWLSALAISPNQCYLATADIGGMIHVWSIGLS